MLYYLDLVGVALFAASGVLAARDRSLDLFGIVLVAMLTAIGGGTLRDLLLDRHPIFWIVDPWYLAVILTAALLTVAYLHARRPPFAMFLVADALGLALFAMTGAHLTLAEQHSPLIAIVMGTMTGVMGGILRDVITAHVPLILKKEIYATSAIAGILAYLGLDALGLPSQASLGCGFTVVVALRLLAIKWDFQLPVISIKH